MSDSRLEKFIYAICSMNVSDLPVPLSRIEKLWNCLITGETPDFEPLSRNEKYLMAMLDRYDISNLPAPMSRGEKLLYKIAVGETDLSDVPGYLSRYEELLKYLIENGGISGGDFEYVLYTLNQSLSTLYLTAEKPVKCAILSGNTLVNLSVNKGYTTLAFTTTQTYKTVFQYNIESYKPNTKYLVITEFNHDYKYNFGVNIPHASSIFNENILIENGVGRVYKHILTTKSDLTGCNTALRTVVYNNTEETDFSQTFRIMIIEYQEGMENWDIPYFEGMKSVKMPVLTTTGKNLFDINSMSNINNWDTVVSNEIPYCSYKINLKPNTTYTFSQKQFVNTENVYASFGLEKGGFEYLLAITHPTAQYPTTFTITTDDRGLIYLKLYNANTTLETFISKLSNNQLQLEESSTATLYEPFKSNILTVNEEVTLRSNGDVYDELNLLTGRLTQRIDENNEVLSQEVVKTVDLTVVDQDNQPTQLGTFENVTHVSLEAENLIPEVEMEVATRISEELASASPLMDDISTEQQQLNETVNEQSNNVDATMIATTEIFEETL